MCVCVRVCVCVWLIVPCDEHWLPAIRKVIKTGFASLKWFMCLSVCVSCGRCGRGEGEKMKTWVQTSDSHQKRSLRKTLLNGKITKSHCILANRHCFQFDCCPQMEEEKRRLCVHLSVKSNQTAVQLCLCELQFVLIKPIINSDLKTKCL